MPVDIAKPPGVPVVPSYEQERARRLARPERLRRRSAIAAPRWGRCRCAAMRCNAAKRLLSPGDGSRHGCSRFSFGVSGDDEQQQEVIGCHGQRENERDDEDQLVLPEDATRGEQERHDSQPDGDQEHTLADRRACEP